MGSASHSWWAYQVHQRWVFTHLHFFHTQRPQGRPPGRAHGLEQADGCLHARRQHPHRHHLRAGRGGAGRIAQGMAIDHLARQIQRLLAPRRLAGDFPRLGNDGEDGLAVLAPALRERGARVELAEVYRRVALPYDSDRISETLRVIDAIVITSGQALDHLVRLTPASMQKALLQKQLVVPGPRMVEKASELGFSALIAPEKMSDAGIVQALEQAQTPK